MRNEKQIIKLLAETFCPSAAGLPEYKDCKGKKDCEDCWKKVTKEKQEKPQNKEP